VPRILYFDLDGTLVHIRTGQLKSSLGGGRFERAVRSARFERLVCVGNAVAIVHALRDQGHEVDGTDMVFRLCSGAFETHDWFCARCALASDPRRRARDIDWRSDWWYVDDLAGRYLAQEGRQDLLTRHRGGRILVPDPAGDGSDLLDWLARAGQTESDTR
jgi:hypothetical protein